MRTSIALSSPMAHQLRARRFFSCRLVGWLSALFLVSATILAGSPCLAAQAPATNAAPTPKKPHHFTRQKHLVAVEPVAVEPVAPPEPELPHWPAKQKPQPATVTWDSHGLRIEAMNSSLVRILEDVATATGTTVEGLGDDQRIFGEYGPGLTRDVLSQLLQGTGYNVLMVGDEGQGTPRQIVLTARDASTATTAGNKKPPSDDDDADVDEPQQPAPAPIRPNPGMPPRTPQQSIQEMQQRQQQMQQRMPPQMQQQNLPQN